MISAKPLTPEQVMREDEIYSFIKLRDGARKDKNFLSADEISNRLKRMGISWNDTRKGTEYEFTNDIWDGEKFIRVARIRASTGEFPSLNRYLEQYSQLAYFCGNNIYHFSQNRNYDGKDIFQWLMTYTEG